jgi:hypothetical protein
VATLTGLGLSGAGGHSGEIRVGFRRGMFRYLGVTVGGAGLLGLAIAVVELARREPQRFFDLLSKWGFIWLLALAGMAFIWDLLRNGMGYLGQLSKSVQESAVAMNRIADKDDRDKDRMQSEIAFIGRRMLALSDDQQKTRDEMREQHREVVALIGEVMKEHGGKANG